MGGGAHPCCLLQPAWSPPREGHRAFLGCCAAQTQSVCPEEPRALGQGSSAPQPVGCGVTIARCGRAAEGCRNSAAASQTPMAGLAACREVLPLTCTARKAHVCTCTCVGARAGFLAHSSGLSIIRVDKSLTFSAVCVGWQMQAQAGRGCLASVVATRTGTDRVHSLPSRVRT